MLVPLKITAVLSVSIVSYPLDTTDYKRYDQIIFNEPLLEKEPQYNKPTMEYNIINSQEYLESLIEKSFYIPVIDDLQKSNAR